MSRHIAFGSWLSLIALLSLGAGCSDPPKQQEPLIGRPSKPPGAKRKADAKKSTGEGKGSGAAPPVMEIQEEDFVETERSRDPFRTYADLFAARAEDRIRVQRNVILEEYSVDDLKLIGIVKRINPAKAMLVDPRGQGHVVQRGDFVGKSERVQASNADTEFELNWRIERIRDQDLVLVREDPSNPDIPSATRVIALRPDQVE